MKSQIWVQTGWAVIDRWQQEGIDAMVFAAEKSNPFVPVEQLLVLILLFIMCCFCYHKWRWRRVPPLRVYQYYCYFAAMLGLSLVFASCSMEFNCDRPGISVSRLTSKGIIGRVWSFLALQVSLNLLFAAVVLKKTYGMSRTIGLAWIAAAVSFAGVAALIPARAGFLANTFHAVFAIGLELSLPVCLLWAGLQAYRTTGLRKVGVSRFAFTFISLGTFLVAIVDVAASEPLTKLIPHLFFYLEIIALLGALGAFMTIAHNEFNAVRVTIPLVDIVSGSEQTDGVIV